jgi:hypothetical protein
MAGLHPHGPEIWTADGPAVVAMMGFHYPTRMAVIRLKSGGLFIWSPVALTPEIGHAVDALGPVRHIVAPNALHHIAVPDWQRAYPDAVVHAPPGLRAKRADITFGADLDDRPYAEWDGEIDQVLVAGNAVLSETVFFHRQSGTAIFADLIQHLPQGWFQGWRALIARLDLMTGPEPSVPRKFRVAFTDRTTARAAIDRVLAWPARSIIIAHGAPVDADGQKVLRRVFRWLMK